MKVRNSLKSLKAKGGTQVVRRRGRTYLISRTSPRLRPVRADSNTPSARS